MYFTFYHFILVTVRDVEEEAEKNSFDYFLFILFMRQNWQLYCET